MRQKPNVLVCNDDGIHAPGVRALIIALHSLDVCNVFVCCPANEQSGKSQSITLGGTIVTRHLHGVHAESLGCIEVHGTPADAVMVGLASDTFSQQVNACSPSRQADGLVLKQTGITGLACWYVCMCH